MYLKMQDQQTNRLLNKQTFCEGNYRMIMTSKKKAQIMKMCD